MSECSDFALFLWFGNKNNICSGINHDGFLGEFTKQSVPFMSDRNSWWNVNSFCQSRCQELDLILVAWFYLFNSWVQLPKFVSFPHLRLAVTKPHEVLAQIASGATKSDDFPGWSLSSRLFRNWALARVATSNSQSRAHACPPSLQNPSRNKWQEIGRNFLHFYPMTDSIGIQNVETVPRSSGSSPSMFALCGNHILKCICWHNTSPDKFILNLFAPLTFQQTPQACFWRRMLKKTQGVLGKNPHEFSILNPKETSWTGQPNWKI